MNLKEQISGFLFLNEIGLTTFVENRGNSTARLLRVFNRAEPKLTTLYDSYFGLPVDVAATMLHLDNTAGLRR